MKTKLVGLAYGWEHRSMAGRIYSPDGISPTLAGASKVSGYNMRYLSIVYEK